MKTNPGDANREGNITGNTTVAAEVHRLQIVNLHRNLTRSDVRSLDQSIAKDPIASDLATEINWLIDNHEDDHVMHSLVFLDDYVTRGETVFCIPHELSHIGLYLKHNDTLDAEKTLTEVQENLAGWYAKQEKARKILPAYYRDFENTSLILNATIDRLAAKDYGQTTLNGIAYLEEHALC